MYIGNPIPNENPNVVFKLFIFNFVNDLESIDNLWPKLMAAV